MELNRLFNELDLVCFIKKMADWKVAWKRRWVGMRWLDGVDDACHGSEEMAINARDWRTLLQEGLFGGLLKRSRSNRNKQFGKMLCDHSSTMQYHSLTF